MAVVAPLAKQRKVPPALLDRSVCLRIRNKQEQESPDITRELLQPMPNLALDLDLVCHGEGNITKADGTRNR